MGASASVERSPLVLRANLLMRYHTSGKHHRTLAQAVYSRLYQSGNWSTWVESDVVFKALWQCLKCENNAPALDHALWLQALGIQCDAGEAAGVLVHGDDMIAFLASGRLPVRQKHSKDDSAAAEEASVMTVTTSETTELAQLSPLAQAVPAGDEISARTNNTSSSAQQPEELLSSCLTIDHLLTLQEWILAPDQSGRSPLDYARQANNSRLLERMHLTLAGGSSPQAEPPSSDQEIGQNGQTLAPSQPFFPLHVAAKTGKLDNIKSLLESGADPLAKDERDNLPIYYACLCGHLECCAHLAEVAGGVQAMDPAERLRCSTNALNPQIRQYLDSGVLPDQKGASPDTDDSDRMTDDTISDLSLLFS